MDAGERQVRLVASARGWPTRFPLLRRTVCLSLASAGPMATASTLAVVAALRHDRAGTPFTICSEATWPESSAQMTRTWPFLPGGIRARLDRLVTVPI